MIDQTGLIWEPTLWGASPKWAVEPSLEAVAKAAYRHLKLSDAEVATATIEFLAQGAFNKVYTITCSKGVFVMRVTLPVDPGYKLASEVAIIDLLRDKTSIPVPKVLEYDLSRNNQIGFEWMLMSLVSGITLDQAFPYMIWDARIKLVDCIVDALAQMFEMRSAAIGNAYHACDYGMLKDPSMLGLNIMPGYVRGKVVSMAFFWDKHITQDIERGPFYTSEQWLEKRLFLARSDAEAIIASSSNKGELEDAETTLGRNIFWDTVRIFMVRITQQPQTLPNQRIPQKYGPNNLDFLIFFSSLEPLESPDSQATSDLY